MVVKSRPSRTPARPLRRVSRVSLTTMRISERRLPSELRRPPREVLVRHESYQSQDHVTEQSNEQATYSRSPRALITSALLLEAVEALEAALVTACIKIEKHE